MTIRQGDTHNFGRRVIVRERRVEKPRALLWEWLVLSRQSPLRQLLEDAARGDGLGKEAFAFLPDLKFFPARPEEAREVERIRLAPLRVLSREKRRELAVIVGRALALFSWLGIADLHWENLVLGLDARGRIVFSPIDIEMILADLSLPTETKLLPDADPEYAAVCRHACGVRRVLPYLKKPIGVDDLVTMASAYLETLSLLDRHAKAVAGVFANLPGLRDTPLRVLLRGTDEYVRSMSTTNDSLWPPLLEEERVQLERGDVPYFFRLYGKPGIHYYAEPSLKKAKRMPLAGDVPQLDPMLRIAQAFRSPSRRKLREEGLLLLLGAFDHKSFVGEHKNDSITVFFGARTLKVKPRGAEEIESSRNLRAFVGSVYLPCKCGEVRTVFVPNVTICS